MAEEFLKKVYDKYLGSDYEFGDSDLNPKREIAKTSLEQLEDEEEAILEKIAERLRQLQAQASILPKYKRPEKVDNDDFVTESSGAGLGSDVSPEDNENETFMKIALGGDADDNHIFFPGGGLDSQVDFLVSELESLALPILVVGETPPSYPGPSPTAPGDIVNLYNPGCDDDTVNSDEYESSNPDYEAFAEKLKEMNGGDDDDDDDDGEGEAGSKSAAEAADSIAEQNLNEASKNVSQRQKEVAECIAKELPILSAILAILKVVNVLKKVLLLILSIVVPIVKMIAFASQCWINPPAAAEVIQMVAEKIAALLITAIGEILQMLWNLLELDCKTEQVQKVLDQINETLTGVSSAISSGKSSTISFIKTSKSLLKSLEDSADKFQQTEQWQNWYDEAKEELDYDKQKERMNDLLLGGQGLTGAGLKTLMTAALPGDIKNSLNKIASSAQKVANNTKKALSTVDFSKDQKTAAAQQTMNNLADLLGTFRIK